MCTQQYRNLRNAVGPYGYGWDVNDSSLLSPRLTVVSYIGGMVDPERRLYNVSGTSRTGVWSTAYGKCVCGVHVCVCVCVCVCLCICVWDVWDVYVCEITVFYPNTLFVPLTHGPQ